MDKYGGKNTLPECLAQDLDRYFSQFMDVYQEEVFKFVYPQVGKDEQSAWNVAAEVFLRVYRTMSGCTPKRIQEHATLPYLRFVAKKAIKDFWTSQGHWQRQKKIDTIQIPLHSPTGLIHDIEDTHAEQPEQELVKKRSRSENNQAFFDKVDKLPEQNKLEKEILVYRFFYELSYDEIDYRFHIPKKIAEKREKVGLQLLKEILIGETTKERR